MSNPTRQETPKVGTLEKLGFATFSTASNVVFNFKDLFYLFFLTNVMGISIAYAGIITAIGIVRDAINDPMVGFWAVNHQFKNGEKVRPFALWCAVPWAITVVLMFTCFDVAYGVKLAIVMAIYFLFELFNTTVKDGCLYGRGALDCKSTMYVELQAVEELLQEGFVPKCDVYLEYSINEETGGDGAAAAMRYLKEQGIRLALVIDEGGAVIEEAVPGMDRPYAVIGITEKGYMDVKITAKGKGGHSSTPPRHTPAARLYAFANEIERKRPFKKKLIPEAKAMFAAMAPSFHFPMRLLLGNIWLFEPLLKVLMPVVSPFGEAVMATTCCFTQMKGSDAPNVIPKEPYLIANLRCSFHQNCEETMVVLKKYGKKYDLDFEILLQRDASPVSDIHSKAYGYVEKTVREHFPDAGVAPYLIMGGTDCRHFHQLTDTALRFAPVRMNNAQNASCHAVNENVTIAALAEGVRFYKRFLKNYPG